MKKIFGSFGVGDHLGSCLGRFWGSFRVGDIYIYIVVQFYPWFKFYFPLFLGMLMYDNELETKENKI